MSWQLDHLALSAETLEAGVGHVEDLLGVALAPGGQHPVMGTHNRLLSLGPDCYFEVIAIEAGAPAPDHPRWFDLDSFKGAPRLTNWIARTDDIDRAIAASPDGVGVAAPQRRGDLRWSMAVPEDGKLPFGGMFPGLISWEGPAHPTAMLPDQKCRLARLHISHPKADELQAILGKVMDLHGISIHTGAANLHAEIATPDRVVSLG